MKPEYDFSEGVRGKFFRPDAELRLPVYLNPDVQAYLAERAAQKRRIARRDGKRATPKRDSDLSV